MKKVLLTATVLFGTHFMTNMVAQQRGSTTDTVPKVSIKIEVDGTQIAINTPDIRTISEKELDEVIKKITRNAQKIAHKMQLMIQRIEYLREQNALDPREADSLFKEIVEAVDEGLAFSKMSKDNWKTYLDDHFEKTNDQLERIEDRIQELENGAGIAYQPPAGNLKKPDKPGLYFKRDSVHEFKFPKYSSGHKASVFHFSFGVNQLGDNSILNADLLRSWTFAIGLHGNRKFTKTSVAGLYYGLSYRWTAFGLPNEVRMVAAPSGIQFVNDPQSTATHSRLRSQSIEVPLLLTFSHKKGFIDGFYFGLGMFGGWRFNNSTFVRDLTANNDMKRETVTYANFHINPLYAGARAIFGVRGVTATVSYEFFSYFRERANLPTLNLLSFTLGIDLTD
ncbi:hypothetical protein [Thermaurantimonas aggregans]|uniref:hypothetical protein n=1 Tax=Thermaurantimonas aggregans TaxID=2173829 RepID=UPI0023F00006|nr:hypothetical protein [Thermaurantimonas aggregans]MCX8147968.1 hypothetical protein [Thermaurantimonas aggregans]